MTKQDLEEILFDRLDLVSGLEEKLWNAANALRSNSSLKASEYATPVLGLIFLKYASNKFELAKETVEAEIEPFDTEEDTKKIYIAKCGFYLPDNAQYNYLLEGKYSSTLSWNGCLTKIRLELILRFDYSKSSTVIMPKLAM